MIKNIFKNFLYKNSGEPVVKIEKTDSQDSGIDFNEPDDGCTTNNVNSSNEMNTVDVIELISEDEDDSLQIVEIHEDESSDVTTSSKLIGVNEVGSNNSKIKGNTLLTNNEKILLDDHANSMEEVSNSDTNMSQNPEQQNSIGGSVNSASTDDSSRKMCAKDETNCPKQNTNSSDIKLESSNSKDEGPENTKVLMYPTPKKKSLPIVSSCVQDISNLVSNSSNASPRLLLFNPHNKVSVSINWIPSLISSTPILESGNRKLKGTPLKMNYNKVLLATKKNNTQPVEHSPAAQEVVSKKINGNTNDKITEIPSVIPSTSTSLSGSKTAEIENSKKPLTESNHTKPVSSPTTHENTAPTTIPHKSLNEGNPASTSQPESKNSSTTPTISLNKTNSTDNQTSTPVNSSSQKNVPAAEKLKTSSIGVQTDQGSIPKNLKRKATDNNSQDATASFSQDQDPPPAKKQKTQSSEMESDVIIRLDGRSVNRIEILNELLENGQERQIVSQFFDEISSVVIVQPPSRIQSTIKIINKSLRSTNKKSMASVETSRTNCNSDILNNNETSSNKESSKENSNIQATTSNNDPVNSSKKSTDKNSNANEKSMNENPNNSQSSNQSVNEKRSDINSNPINENLNNTNLYANIKMQKNGLTASTSTSSTQAVNKNVKSESNCGGSFSLSGWVQYGTRLLNRTDRICFTGQIDEKRQTAIEKLGGRITNDPLDATVLVADKFRRTFKFICAICRSIPIVSTQWINESITKNDFVNPYDYILKDEEAEKNYSFHLQESLVKAKKKQLLQNYTILITPGVNCPSVNELKTIVKLAGGRGLVRAPKLWGAKSMIISCDEDASKVRRILEKKPPEVLCPVVDANFILSSLLQQDLQISTQNLKVEKKS